MVMRKLLLTIILLRDGVNYVFVEHDSFKRDSLYGYLDDNRRFFIFDYAILEYIGLVI